MATLASCPKCGSENTHVRCSSPGRSIAPSRRPDACSTAAAAFRSWTGIRSSADWGGQLRLVEPLKLDLVHARFVKETARPATSAPSPQTGARIAGAPYGLHTGDSGSTH